MALNAGFSAPIVMALGGWKTERMMRRYAAVTDQTLRRAADAVSEHTCAPLLPRLAGATLTNADFEGADLVVGEPQRSPTVN